MSRLQTYVAGCTSAIVLSFGLVSDVSAATLDFTTSTYDATFGPNVATDLVDGVNFTVTAYARGVNGFRQGSGRGLSFGVPGNGMYSISIVADQDLLFNSMYGKGHSLTTYAGQLPFNIAVEGSDVSTANMFSSTAFETISFDNGPVELDAGEAFSFYVDFGSLTGSSIYASALVKSLDFAKAGSGPSPVPLPAGLPLLFGSLGLLGLVRRKQRAS